MPYATPLLKGFMRAALRFAMAPARCLPCVSASRDYVPAPRSCVCACLTECPMLASATDRDTFSNARTQSYAPHGARLFLAPQDKEGSPCLSL